LNHNEHNEHNENGEKPGRLVSSPHPTVELHALGKVSLLFVLVVLVVLVVVNWFQESEVPGKHQQGDRANGKEPA
jgi:hypothetical protein